MRGFTTPETVHNSILIINLSDAKKYSILKKENLPVIPSAHGKIMKHMKKINQRILSCSPKRGRIVSSMKYLRCPTQRIYRSHAGLSKQKKALRSKKGLPGAPRGKKKCSREHLSRALLRSVLFLAIKPIGASPCCDYVLTRMVHTTNNSVCYNTLHCTE